MKIKIFVWALLWVVPFCLLSCIVFLVRIFDNQYDKKHLIPLGKFLQEKHGLSSKKIIFKISKKGSGTNVVIYNKKYAVYVKIVKSRILIHELEHIRNGSADEAFKLIPKLTPIFTILFKIPKEIKSFLKELTFWPEIKI